MAEGALHGGTPASSQVSVDAALSQADLVTVRAKKILAMSKGRVRVPLEDLGPALFNRQGQATCGRHCHDLGERIVKVEGFATYRYEHGFCHEPDPASPMAVAQHGNKMADRDPLLPRLPGKPLKGIFAKTHLVTFLQLLKGGHMPGLTQFLGGGQGGLAPSGSPAAWSQDELQDVIDHGIYMHVFPWSAVRDHKDDIVALMASDNFDHGHGLSDSELRCVKGIRHAILTLPVPPGMSQVQAVRDHVVRLAGQKWHEKDFGAFWEFAKTTLDLHLDFLMEVWTYAECESVLKVDSAWFAQLARLPAKSQWSRAALAVTHFLSDRETECTLVAGSYVAGAVPKAQLNRLCAKCRTKEQIAMSEELEEWLQLIMERYYVPWANDPASAPFKRSAWTKGLAAFLLKMGRQLANDKSPDDSSRAKLEAKLRATLEQGATGPMPERVTALSQGETAPRTAAAMETDTLMATDEGGRAVVSQKRLASEAGLEVDSEVVKKRANGDGFEPSVGRVRSISDLGVVVTWPEGADLGGSAIPVSELALAPKKPKEKSVANQALELPGIKWSQCSNAENTSMLFHMACSTLYQVYVSQSAAHSDLHLIENDAATASSQGKIGLYVTRDLKAGALALLPFSGDLVDGTLQRPAGSCPMAMVMKPKEEEPTVVPFWVKPKAVPKKMALSQERAVVLVPFWCLASKPESSDGQTNAQPLEYKTATIPLGTPCSVEKGVRTTRGSISMRVLYMSNSSPLVKGTRIFITTRPPNALHEEKQDE